VESFRFAEKDPTMAKNRAYPPEFRAKIIELARSGKSVSSIAQEYDVARLTITNWLKQDDLDAGRRSDGLSTAESAEVAKLRKKVRELEIERDILKKAAAWFARETDSVPAKSSNS
jgi:transposase